jgi:hypothetical protein
VAAREICAMECRTAALDDSSHAPPRAPARQGCSNARRARVTGGAALARVTGRALGRCATRGPAVAAQERGLGVRRGRCQAHSDRGGTRVARQRLNGRAVGCVDVAGEAKVARVTGSAARRHERASCSLLCRPAVPGATGPPGLLVRGRCRERSDVLAGERLGFDEGQVTHGACGVRRCEVRRTYAVTSEAVFEVHALHSHPRTAFRAVTDSAARGPRLPRSCHDRHEGVIEPQVRAAWPFGSTPVHARLHRPVVTGRARRGIGIQRSLAERRLLVARRAGREHVPMFPVVEALRLCLLRGRIPPRVRAQGDGHEERALQRGYGPPPAERGMRCTAGGSPLSSAPLPNETTTRALARS